MGATLSAAWTDICTHMVTNKEIVTTVKVSGGGWHESPRTLDYAEYHAAAAAVESISSPSLTICFC